MLTDDAAQLVINSGDVLREETIHGSGGKDRRRRSLLISPFASHPTSPSSSTHALPPLSDDVNPVGFKKKKPGTTRHIKFSHLFSVFLDVVILACVIYVCYRVDKYWFTFSAPLALQGNDTAAGVLGIDFTQQHASNNFPRQEVTHINWNREALTFRFQC